MTDERLNIVDCIQGDPLWLAARAGSVTSSRVADAVAKLKRKEGESAARLNYRFDIVTERLTKNCVEHYVSRWMEEGKEKEPLARTAYELQTGNDVELVGFVLHPSIQWAGASPDGLVGRDGLVEFKAPKTRTHLQYLLNDCAPAEYLPQIYWQMACCPGREWCDFVSYDPSLPEELQTFVCRVERNEDVIQQMEEEVRAFLAECERLVQQLKGKDTAGRLRLSIAQARAGLLTSLEV